MFLCEQETMFSWRYKDPAVIQQRQRSDFSSMTSDAPSISLGICFSCVQKKVQGKGRLASSSLEPESNTVGSGIKEG